MTSEQKLLAIPTSTPKWPEIVVEGYQQEPQSKALLTELSLTGTNDKGFSLTDGVIRYKNKVWLGNHTATHNAVLQAFHSSGPGGHSGITATYHKVKGLFAWLGMKQGIKDYVSKCQVCQQPKSKHFKLPSLLQPLPVPSQARHTISMDFIEGLPKSQKYDTILVVIDKFTRYGHFLPLSHPFTAHTVAQAFFSNVYKLHGLPIVIISDKDMIFSSTLWQELFKLTETTLNMSSSYHPKLMGKLNALINPWKHT